MIANVTRRCAQPDVRHMERVGGNEPMQARADDELACRDAVQHRNAVLRSHIDQPGPEHLLMAPGLPRPFLLHAVEEFLMTGLVPETPPSGSRSARKTAHPAGGGLARSG